MSSAISRWMPLGIAVWLASAGVGAGDATAEPRTGERAGQPAVGSCLKDTGSRIRRPEGRPCISAPGRAYTREDIDRTGAATTADALRKLSPAVR